MMNSVFLSPLGRLDPAALGGAGAAIAAQYSVAKLYTDPMLRTTISLVAAQVQCSISNPQHPL